MPRMAGAVTVAALSTGAVASAASAASLKVTVPSQVKNGTRYGVQVEGSYKPKELTGRAYVITLIQYNGRPCRATAQAENLWAIQSHASIDFYLRTKAHLIGSASSRRGRRSHSRTGSAPAVSAPAMCAPTCTPSSSTRAILTAPIARADKRLKVAR